MNNRQNIEMEKAVKHCFFKIIPLSLKEANAYVEQHHRHHAKVQGHKFSIGCMCNDKLVGVCIVGRPVSRYLDDGKTLEVTRLCTDGTYNLQHFVWEGI